MIKMTEYLLRYIKKKYINLKGFHTSRKIVVIESDDWGSIRTPSKVTLDYLKSLGDNAYADAFLSSDSLESVEDLEKLFEVLKSVKDSRGNFSKITANFAVANPDFETIDLLKGEYCYEIFTETYKKYYGDEKDVFKLIRKGISEKIFYPQLHCREHMNVKRWMRDLMKGKEDTRLAFKNKMIGIGASFSHDNKFGYMDAFNIDNKEELQQIGEIILSAANIFEEVFGYRSVTFVASCFVWPIQLEQFLARAGVRCIQTSEWQYIPTYSEGTLNLQRKLHYTGEKSKNGLIYTVRNCSYEPAYLYKPFESANKCLQEISESFNAGKPAIINSHRFNYINAINKKNANENLLGLQYLLNEIVNKWTDVEFMTSEELAELILGSSK